MTVDADGQHLVKDVEYIVGVKEASGDLTKMAETLRTCQTGFSVWSGNDDQAVAAMSLGGAGVISVVSNLLPERVQAMSLAALDGDFDTAAALQLELLPLIRTLFREINPIPVKAAMEIIGFDCGACRLPLTPPDEKTLQELRAHLFIQ